MRSTATLILTIISILLGCALAEQLRFQRLSKNGKMAFHYQWIDMEKENQSIHFSIENQILFSHFRDFKNFQPHTIQDEIFSTLRKTTAPLDPKEVSVELSKFPQHIAIAITGDSPAKVQEVRQLVDTVKEEVFTNFLTNNFYHRYQSSAGVKGIKPDHSRIVELSINDVDAISKAFKQKFSDVGGRKQLEYLLSFIQSIPYDTLTSRIESNGAGFSPPLRLIYNNKGDCDSKTALMAAVAKRMFPSLQIALIFLSDHALIGFQLPHVKSEAWVKIEGLDFILSEPTGPAQIPFAQVADSSLVRIKSRQFTYEFL